MKEKIILGIDCGGTHTDAALLALDEEAGACRLLAHAKTQTRHDDLPTSIAEAATGLGAAARALFERVERITLGTTLAINAIVQGRADKVGLALSAGPGLDPVHFILGDYYCIVPGGLDHRGQEVEPLYLDVLKREAVNWPEKGVRAIACVGKFSPRNSSHEDSMAKAVAGSRLPVTLGHKLSGSLNFPRRIATAYYNAAVSHLHNDFLMAVKNALSSLGLKGQLRLLKADGGAIPFSVSEQEPVQSILSGPAASVMGAMALWEKAFDGCSLLLDIGGTTTDIAMLLNGSPVVDRNGMELEGRRTLVKSLASRSVGVGGDSLLKWRKNDSGEIEITVGPERLGPAMAFGGTSPSFMDALNLQAHTASAGNVGASLSGLQKFAEECGLNDPQLVADMAIDNAMARIVKAVYALTENINSSPVYTLASLKAVREARPVKACLVGGPAKSVCGFLEKALGIEVEIGPMPGVANAIGAAVSLPTISLEVYADTGKGILSAPALDFKERISRNFTLEDVKEKAIQLLKSRLAESDIEYSGIEVVEADLFATLDDMGNGGRDMRVTCQARPGIAGLVKLKAE